MTLHRLSLRKRQLLLVAVEHELPNVAAGWKRWLASGQMTDEMRDVFEALDWLPSDDGRRRPRRTSPSGWGHTEIREDAHPHVIEVASLPDPNGDEALDSPEHEEGGDALRDLEPQRIPLD
jgi:hypothetical protein